MQSFAYCRSLSPIPGVLLGLAVCETIVLHVTLDGRRLTMRIGSLRAIDLDIGEIAAFRTSWDSAAISERQR